MWDQDDSVDLLPFSEFCSNNAVHEVIKETPFFAAYHQHPKNNFKNPRDNVTETNNSEAVKTVEDLDAMRESMRENRRQLRLGWLSTITRKRLTRNRNSSWETG